MKVNHNFSVTKQAKFLITTNVLLLGLLLTICIKENYISRFHTYLFERKKVESFSYSLNPKFIEQVDYCSIYKTRANIVMLGNSLTYRMNWTELLERSDIANRGVGSDITSGFLDRLKFVIPLKPKIVFIEGGVNDLERNIDTFKILSNVKLIIAELKKNSIIPVLTMVTYVTENYENSKAFNDKISLLNKSYTQLAEKEQIKILDLNKSLAIDKTLKNEFAEQDGIHLTSKGYLIWKEEIIKILADFKI